jgi:hypothetical protein
MTLIRNLLGTNPVAGGEPDPEAVSFRGNNSVYDKLGRSSDLSGNVNTKQLTMSFWWYATTEGTAISFSGTYVRVEIAESGELDFVGLGVGATSVIQMTTAVGIIPLNTWTHIAISIDLTSAGSRAIYVNDKSVSFTVGYYQNLDMQTSGSNIEVAKSRILSTATQGLIRMAHVFADYTYRDLSTVSNRRLFIDADGKPASGQADLSPILYLPMTDAATAGSNSGTGGDFTVTGVLDTAGRAPNQFNCSASEFNGANDYLSLTISDTITRVLLSFSVKFNTIAGDDTIFKNDNGFAIYWDGINTLSMTFYNGSVFNELKFNSGEFKTLHKMYSIQVLYDVGAGSSAQVIVNGNVFTAFTSDTNSGGGLRFYSTKASVVGVHDSQNARFLDGELGELYIGTAPSGLNLATDNPFWDSDTNRPKPVRQVIEETGTTPLIALPLRADDAGNNLGSGGDFTVNSGPFTGVRGGSEYWQRSSSYNGFNNNNGLTRSGLTGASNTSTLSAVVIFKPSYSQNQTIHILSLGFSTSSNSKNRVTIKYAPTYIELKAQDTSGNWQPSINGPTGVSTGQPEPISVSLGVWHTAFFSISTSGNSYCIFDGTQYSNFEVNSNTIGLGQANRAGINLNTENGVYDDDRSQELGLIYFDDSYIDFSQESNRNLFVDQLGYPKNLTPAIEAGDIAEPLIYMKFDDTSALGTNSGTGGDFTVNGTVTAGADVDPNA